MKQKPRNNSDMKDPAASSSGATSGSSSRHSGSKVAQPRPTLKTIAYLTNLGTTTISKALADAPDISAATKQRVRAVADEIGYRPNRAGVRLRTGKTNVISLVLSLEEEVMGLTSQMVMGLSEILTDTDYHLIITPYSTASGPMEPVRYIVETGSADGIILSRTELNDERVRYLHSKNMPFATHGRTETGIEHPYHDFDNELFARKAVELLVSRGCSRLAVVAPAASLTYYQHVIAGYNAAVLDTGVDSCPIDHINTDMSLDTVEERIRELMLSKNRPDGIISLAGATAIAITAGLEAAGLELGKDVHLVSKQSVNLLTRFRDEIAVVNEDIRLAGRELATAIVKSIDGVEPQHLQNIVYPT